MTLSIVLLVTGFVILVKGGDLLVNGSSSIAKHFNVSELVIGLTIVSLGTSAPELLVNIFAATAGKSGIALGNVFGSNICNTFLILGSAAVVAPVAIRSSTVRKEIPFSIIIGVVLFLLLNDALWGDASRNYLSRSDGLVLLALFLLFMYYVYTMSRSNKDTARDETPDMGIKKSSIFVAIGLTGLVLGGKLVVTGAVDIASGFGVSEAMIGLTVVAIGTSLPELFASVMAARRGKPDLVIGNVIGSNIFNILFVLGISSVVSPMTYLTFMNYDLGLVIVSTVVVLAFMFSGKGKQTLERWEGGVLIAAYAAYLAYLALRG